MTDKVQPSSNLLVNRIITRRGENSAMLSPWFRSVFGKKPDSNKGGNPVSIFKYQNRGVSTRMLSLGNIRSELVNFGRISGFGSMVARKYQSVVDLVIRNRMPDQGTGMWGEVDRIFPGGTSLSHAERHIPGELRRGSVIQKIDMFPRPGKSPEEFRSQSDQDFQKQAIRSDTVKKQVIPGQRLFSRITEMPNQKPVEITPGESEEFGKIENEAPFRGQEKYLSLKYPQPPETGEFPTDLEETTLGEDLNADISAHEDSPQEFNQKEQPRESEAEPGDLFEQGSTPHGLIIKPIETYVTPISTDSIPPQALPLSQNENREMSVPAAKAVPKSPALRADKGQMGKGAQVVQRDSDHKPALNKAAPSNTIKQAPVSKIQNRASVSPRAIDNPPRSGFINQNNEEFSPDIPEPPTGVSKQNIGRLHGISGGEVGMALLQSRIVQPNMPGKGNRPSMPLIPSRSSQVLRIEPYQADAKPGLIIPASEIESDVNAANLQYQHYPAINDIPFVYKQSRQTPDQSQNDFPHEIDLVNQTVESADLGPIKQTVLEQSYKAKQAGIGEPPGNVGIVSRQVSEYSLQRERIAPKGRGAGDVDLGTLAEDVFPYLKKLLEIERERSLGI